MAPRYLFACLLLAISFTVTAQKRNLSLMKGLHLDFTGKADVELMVQRYTSLGQQHSDAPWVVLAQSRTMPTAGFMVNGTFSPAQPAATGKDEDDSVYNAKAEIPYPASVLWIQLHEDSAAFRISPPPALEFSTPPLQPLMDSNIISAGTRFTWVPAPGGADSLFVEIEYNPASRRGKPVGRRVVHRFFLPDTGTWQLPASLLKGIPDRAIVSVRINRGFFIKGDTGNVRYEATVFEAAERSYMRR